MPDEPAPNDRLPVGYEAVARERVADQIVAALQSRIASGELPPGAKLPTERELAKVFGVSLPTVREAIRGLATTGLVEVRQGSGTYVASNMSMILDRSLAILLQLEKVHLLEVFDLLIVLNRYVGEISIEAATDADLSALRAAAEASADCHTQDEANEAVLRFLLTFVGCAHQPLLDALCGFLIRMLTRIESTSYGERSVTFWRRWARDTAPLRLDIVDALEARDRRLLTEQLDRYQQRIRARIQRVPALRNARMSDPALVSLLSDAAVRPVREHGDS